MTLKRVKTRDYQFVELLKGAIKSGPHRLKSKRQKHKVPKKAITTCKEAEEAWLDEE